MIPECKVGSPRVLAILGIHWAGHTTHAWPNVLPSLHYFYSPSSAHDEKSFFFPKDGDGDVVLRQDIKHSVWNSNLNLPPFEPYSHNFHRLLLPFFSCFGSSPHALIPFPSKESLLSPHCSHILKYKLFPLANLGQVPSHQHKPS